MALQLKDTRRAEAASASESESEPERQTRRSNVDSKLAVDGDVCAAMNFVFENVFVVVFLDGIFRQPTTMTTSTKKTGGYIRRLSLLVSLLILRDG